METLDDLLRAYKQSPDALMCSPTTCYLRERAFSHILSQFGRHVPLGDLESRSFRTRLYNWRDENAAKPTTVAQYIRHLNIALNWAVDRNLLRDNPVTGFRHLRRPTPRSEIIWEWSQFTALRAAAQPTLRPLLDLALWTGLRRADLLDLRAFQAEAGWLTVTPQKTKRRGISVFLPYHLVLPLAATMMHLLRAEWRPETHLLRDEEGQPWTRWTLRYRLEQARAAAGLPNNLHLHDLRGTLISWLIDSGCTDAEVGSISGHALTKQGNMRNYIARSRSLAEHAYTKLADNMEDLTDGQFIPRRLTLPEISQNP